MKNLYVSFVLLIAVITVNNSFAQCGPCTYSINGNNNSNYNLNNGETICILQGATFTGNINLNGGTVCNNGSISNSSINFNSGKIFNYGNFTKSNGLSIGGEFYNYGTLTIGNNININNNGRLYNYANAQLDLSGHLHNNFMFYNYGNMTIGGNYNANNNSVNENHGVLTMTNGTLHANSLVLNEGSLNIKGDVRINNGGGLINGNDDRIRIDGNLENNSNITNNGSIEVTGHFTNNGGANFANNLSITVLGNFMNNGNITGDAVGCNVFSVFGNNIVQNGGANMNSIDFCGNSVPGNFTTNYGNVASNVTFCSCSSNGITPLPIVLKSFESICSEAGVNIEWKTSTEINNAYFTILRSNDAINWEPIQVIGGAGNSNAELSYSYTDNRHAAGVLYYRLKQTDYDGTEELFTPVSVQCDVQERTVSIFPNPVDEQLNISINGSSYHHAAIELVDFSGRVVVTKSFIADNAGNIVTLDRNGLSSGAYLVRISLDGEVSNIQKVVLR